MYTLEIFQVRDSLPRCAIKELWKQSSNVMNLNYKICITIDVKMRQKLNSKG